MYVDDDKIEDASQVIKCLGSDSCTKNVLFLSVLVYNLTISTLSTVTD